MENNKLEEYEGKLVRYSSNVTKHESWYGLIRTIVPDEDGEIEINGCRHDIKSIVIHESIRTKDGIII